MWQAIHDNPGYTFLIIWVLGWTVTVIWSRLMRALTVRKAGWPPPHLDADGDAITKE